MAEPVQAVTIAGRAVVVGTVMHALLPLLPPGATVEVVTFQAYRLHLPHGAIRHVIATPTMVHCLESGASEKGGFLDVVNRAEGILRVARAPALEDEDSITLAAFVAHLIGRVVRKRGGGYLLSAATVEAHILIREAESAGLEARHDVGAVWVGIRRDG